VANEVNFPGQVKNRVLAVFLPHPAVNSVIRHPPSAIKLPVSPDLFFYLTFAG
jgi:hypothetical protein